MGGETMVDSRKDSAMADRIDDLTERVQTVEEKLDRLSASVDQRFDQVDAAFIEQRQYTEFAYSRLDAKMDVGFAKMDARFAKMDAKIDGGFAKTDTGFARLERKLDQFIDVQLQTNQLVERRLRALEE